MPRYHNLLENIGKNTIFCSNLGLGEQGAVLSQLKCGIFIAPNNQRCSQIEAQLKALNKNCVVINDSNKHFTLSKFSSSENKYDLISALFAIANENSIIISTPQFLFTALPDINTFKSSIIHFEKGKDYNINEIERSLVTIGYKKVESVTTKGEFSVRGDVVDIFNSINNLPTRLDFFDTQLEDIYTFDFLSFERKENLTEINITPNQLLLIAEDEKQAIISNLSALQNESETITELLFSISRNDDLPLEFLMPFSQNLIQAHQLNLPIIISNELQFANIYNSNLLNIEEKINSIFKNEKLKNVYLNNKNNKKYFNIDDFYAKNANKLIFFENFNIFSTDLKNKFPNIINIDFKTKNFNSFLLNLQELEIAMQPFKEKQIYLCLDNAGTVSAIKKIFDETHVKYSTNKNEKGIILTSLKIPYNICFEDDDKFYIGSTNFAHKKETKEVTKRMVKYLPKAGEYVVHSTHGIGKCEGVVNLFAGGVEKEFFKLSYRGGDTLYVPYESADCLSLYMADGNNVNLNKLGGKEFDSLKQKAIKSIEDMSGELLELYAKRKAVKGFKYSEDDYLFTEFENSFEYTETADQLSAIADIKKDMHSGKVMDRLICGDVGFGKTEVAMRALFKAVENGKQVAILAPTTVLSLQHYLTASSRTKDFGVKVEMLNRFKTAKEQKAILEDLQSGKINVICGTHRLLSNDVKFEDLGLLILDEEQRFGVKAKEYIKQMKNNVNVLTLSATPIPRTLSMSLMNVRDISIISTPPVDRLPVKTYVLGYNEDIILNAIHEEVNRGGQVLVIFNNVEKIYTFANELKAKLNNPKAVFDVAHGQMSEIALENAIKRLYDRQTNVFVSTTLIENGVDLPKANTLIVIDSDKLGLSQMYQLRGRVGRNTEQAYAYFTYNKHKALTEESASRLQAIAENTELGSGFKIAMRDLAIRGAGELLGKTQHGHMIKIGYDMYSKLLNETLRKLKGEKVEVEREIKIDVALSSKIPTEFVSDEGERLKIIAKISNISSKETARATINELLVNYGKLPKEIYLLVNISLLKALGLKAMVKHIVLNKTKMTVTFYSDINLQNLIKKVGKFAHFKFEAGALPTISLNPSEFSILTSVNYLLEFFND